jgi:hypothetical protein
MCLKAEKVSNLAVKKRFGALNLFFRLKKPLSSRLSQTSKATMEGKSFIHHKQNLFTTLLEEKRKWLNVKTAEPK